MPTGIYKLKDGTLVPGTTTIMGAFKDSGGLVHWAWQQGKAGLDYRNTRDKAAERGTNVHDLAECYILDRMYEVPKDKIVLRTFNKFKDWWDTQEFEVVWTEKQMVSERYKYGGCPDLYVRQKSNNMFWLIDFKTGKRIYPDTVIQMGAYKNLIEENLHERVLHSAIVRLPKNNEEIDIKTFQEKDLILGFKQFKNFRKAWNFNKKISELFEQKGKK